MLLSIIVPAYNVETYIKNCIESLENQDIDYNDYEIIIVNDGSTDHTERECQALREKYPNIVVSTTENGGISKARNYGVTMAKGKYIEFVDSDDYIAEKSLCKVAEYVKQDADVICFGHKTTTVLDDKHSNEINIRPPRVYTSGKDCFAKESIDNGPWWYWINREFLQENKLSFAEGKFCEDGVFTCNLFSKAKKVVYTNIDVYRYFRARNDSITKKCDDDHLLKMIDDFQFAVKALNDLYFENKNNSSEEYLYALKNRMNSYIFFLQTRVLRFGKVSIAAQILKNLKGMGVYPYRWIPHDRWYYKLLNKLFQHYCIYIIMCFMYGIYRRIKK